MAFKILLTFALIAATSAVALPADYYGQGSAPIVEDFTEKTPTRQPYISAFRDDQPQGGIQQQHQQLLAQQPIEYTYYEAQPQAAAGHVLQQREVQLVQPTHTQVIYPKQELTAHISSQYQEEEEHNGPAEYDFAYSVHDEKTGDIKQQKESRHGDAVTGEYSLVEPDGHLRTVKYSADKHTGFVAEVSRAEIKGYESPAQQKASYY